MRTFRLLALVVGIVAIQLHGTPCAAESAEELFNLGNAAYTDERWEEAVEAYETVLRYKIRDPRLEYNLGNAAFRLGQLGKSILHFERARQLDPTDPDIEQNLAYARSFCFDRVEPAARPLLLDWIDRVQDRLGPDRHGVIVLVLVWFIGAVAAIGLFRPGSWKAIHGWTIATSILCLALVVSSWYFTYARLDGRQLAVVLVDAANVLAGPGENNPALFTVHEGLTVEVREVREEWIQVSLPNGLHGWLFRDTLGQV